MVLVVGDAKPSRGIMRHMPSSERLLHLEHYSEVEVSFLPLFQFSFPWLIYLGGTKCGGVGCGGLFFKILFSGELKNFFPQTERVAILFEWSACNAPQLYLCWNLAHFIFQPFWIIIDLFEWQLSKWFNFLIFFVLNTVFGEDLVVHKSNGW